MLVTKELINSLKTKSGGYTDKTISIFGNFKGWKLESIGKTITDEEYKLIKDSIEYENKKYEARKNKEYCLQVLNKQRKKAKKKRKAAEKNKINLTEKNNYTKKVIQPNIKFYREKINFYRSPKFLDSYEWANLRMMALKKYGGTCMCCGQSRLDGITLNVDHIKPRLTHPELALDINNLQILCSMCNKGKGNWDETDWRLNSEK